MVVETLPRTDGWALRASMVVKSVTGNRATLASRDVGRLFIRRDHGLRAALVLDIRLENIGARSRRPYGRGCNCKSPIGLFEVSIEFAACRAA